MGYNHNRQQATSSWPGQESYEDGQASKRCIWLEIKSRKTLKRQLRISWRYVWKHTSKLIRKEGSGKKLAQTQDWPSKRFWKKHMNESKHLYHKLENNSCCVTRALIAEVQIMEYSAHVSPNSTEAIIKCVHTTTLKVIATTIANLSLNLLTHGKSTGCRTLLLLRVVCGLIMTSSCRTIASSENIAEVLY